MDMQDELGEWGSGHELVVVDDIIEGESQQRPDKIVKTRYFGEDALRWCRCSRKIRSALIQSLFMKKTYDDTSLTASR
ncbi:hypothetical protein SCHPADRAFT_902508 [Schizopora paradoxa]|uniref:Uncharacterized protein n=1 Tax=Schizopora paradoxa TaxID=27342 RepID=A0A0H2RUT1_9AGAM|nr:hypothetical protein SCHPADRAFT_902508 [Schizopora paradoxa]